MLHARPSRKGVLFNVRMVATACIALVAAGVWLCTVVGVTGLMLFLFARRAAVPGAISAAGRLSICTEVRPWRIGPTYLPCFCLLGPCELSQFGQMPWNWVAPMFAVVEVGDRIRGILSDLLPCAFQADSLSEEDVSINNEESDQRRVYRPRPSAVVEYAWGLAPLALGVAGLVALHETTFKVVASVVMCLLGVWSLLSTRAVLGTWFVTTSEQIISVSPRWQIGVRWEQVNAVVIRQRPSGFPPGRMDRLVTIRNREGVWIPFNTSILSEDDEIAFLEEIHRRAACPIETVNDSLLLNRRGGA